MKTQTINNHKRVISDKLFETIASIDGVCSVTIVGSFCDNDDLSAISDIDTIVICNELTEELYEKCVSNVRNLTGNELGFPGRSVHVNSTLGPLKFDTEELIVIHLMIYDIEGHRNHVLKSPFTCYDWERSKLYVGLSLKDVYPAFKLQPKDFLQARRGLKNYLDDLSRGIISYRRYDFKNGKVNEILEHKPLDPRHQGEYAFHIVRNLVTNYSKLVVQDNAFFSDEELLRNWRRFLPDCAYFIPYFERLHKIKLKRESQFPPDTVARTKDFVLRFEEQFKKIWQRCPNLWFVRHAPTPLNNGSFLGQGRNPAIMDNIEIPTLQKAVKRVFCSPLKRAVQTAQCMAPEAVIAKDSRLLEIQYGRAEGLTCGELETEFPEVVRGWKNGRDPCFPEGESTAMVCKRLSSFLEEQKNATDSCLVVTHNVVLRCLAGYLYGIPLEKWHMLRVPHLELMEVVNKEKTFCPNFSTELKAALTDSLLTG